MWWKLRKHWRLSVGLVGVLAVAGCAGQYLMQREPWRKEAEVACLKSGAVRESGTIVRIEPINGPGMCGADFPMKVAALGETQMLSYTGSLRPPGSIPDGGSQGSVQGSAQPRWPVTSTPRNAPAYPGEQQYSNPMRPSPSQQPYPSQSNPYPSANNSAPMPITPPAAGGGYSDRGSVYDAPAAVDVSEPVRTRSASAVASGAPFRGMPQASTQAAAPMPVPLGGAVAAVGPVEIKPAATLACPIVSALDRWILDSVQPAAQRWFRQPVVEIRQISAYSCRGMNGQQGAKISEHAFGNALDIASFMLADGRRITVKNGWKGSPEEQGFLRDVQGAACEQFSTVLAPGSNRFHYDHIHVDLMRRASGRRICNPDQIPGDVVAERVAKQRGYAWRPDSGVTGSVSKTTRRASLNGSPKAKSGRRNILSADDDDWIEDDGPRPAH